MIKSSYFPEPIIALDVPAALEDELQRQLDILEAEGKEHPLAHGDDAVAWVARNRELAQRANEGDDDALVDLCDRDPRYLATPLARMKMLLWRLAEYNDLVVRTPSPTRAGVGDPVSPDAPRHEREIVEQRRSHMARLALAVAPIAERKRYLSRATVRAEYPRLREQVRKARTDATMARYGRDELKKIAARIGLAGDEDDLRRLRTTQGWGEGLIVNILARRYGVDRSEVEKAISASGVAATDRYGYRRRRPSAEVMPASKSSSWPTHE